MKMRQWYSQWYQWVVLLVYIALCGQNVCPNLWSQYAGLEFRHRIAGIATLHIFTHSRMFCANNAGNSRKHLFTIACGLDEETDPHRWKKIVRLNFTNSVNLFLSKCANGIRYQITDIYVASVQASSTDSVLGTVTCPIGPELHRY